MMIKDDVVVPVSFPVTFNGVTYTVYVTRGDVQCYVSGPNGHIARASDRSFSKRVAAPPEDFPPLPKDQSLHPPVMTTLKHNRPARPPLVKTNNLFVPQFATIDSELVCSNCEAPLPPQNVPTVITEPAPAMEAERVPPGVGDSPLAIEHLTSISETDRHTQDAQQESMEQLPSYTVKRKTSVQSDEDIVPKVLRADDYSYKTVATDEDDVLSQRSYSTVSGKENDTSNAIVAFVLNEAKASIYPISLERFRALMLAVHGR